MSNNNNNNNKQRNPSLLLKVALVVLFTTQVVSGGFCSVYLTSTVGPPLASSVWCLVNFCVFVVSFVSYYVVLRKLSNTPASTGPSTTPGKIKTAVVVGDARKSHQAARRLHEDVDREMMRQQRGRRPGMGGADVPFAVGKMYTPRYRLMVTLYPEAKHANPGDVVLYIGTRPWVDARHHGSQGDDETCHQFLVGDKVVSWYLYDDADCCEFLELLSVAQQRKKKQLEEPGECRDVSE